MLNRLDRGLLALGGVGVGAVVGAVTAARLVLEVLAGGESE